MSLADNKRIIGQDFTLKFLLIFLETGSHPQLQRRVFSFKLIGLVQFASFQIKTQNW